MNSHRTTHLPHGLTEVPRLGLGCAYLTGGIEMKRNLRIVDAAIDAGIRHFDVAPLYGIGTAEAVLGGGLVGRPRAGVTIASKVGRARPTLTMSTQLKRLLATPIRRHFSGVLRKLERARLAPLPTRGFFQVAEIRASLAESLTQLRTDYLDLLLLHEANDQDITDELLDELDELRRKEIVRSTGVASNYERLCRIAPEKLSRFDILQYSWDVFDAGRSPPPGPTFHILHRAIFTAFERLQSLARRSESARLLIKGAIGHESDWDIAILAAALAMNTKGLVLFGTRNEKRVSRNFLALSDPGSRELGERLIQLLPRLLISATSNSDNNADAR